MGSAAGLFVIFGIILAAGASFFFALSESALFALGKWKARQLAEHSPQRGRLVLSSNAPPRLLPNLEIVPRVNAAYEEQIAANPPKSAQH